MGQKLDAFAIIATQHVHDDIVIYEKCLNHISLHYLRQAHGNCSATMAKT